MKRTLFALSVALISAFGSLGAAEWYVAPNGSPNGNGSKESPWDLKTALVQTGVVRAGDTPWLRGGRYGTGGATMFTATLSGSSTAPVIVRGYPGEHATADGGVTCNNGHVWFWGFEIMNSSTGRKVQNAERPPGLTLYGVGDKATNMVIPAIRASVYGTMSAAAAPYQVHVPKSRYSRRRKGSKSVSNCVSVLREENRP